MAGDGLRAKVMFCPGGTDAEIVSLFRDMESDRVERKHDYRSSTDKIRQAICAYSNRIEIINPGGLFGEVTPETIWQNATAYRNPLLAEGLKNLGVVERFGFGLAQARRALAENRNPPLGFQFEPNFTLFRVEPAR